MSALVLAVGDTHNLPAGNKEKATWRQHTRASVFAERFMWTFRANQKQWDIAIANHAGPGQLLRSLLSPLEA